MTSIAGYATALLEIARAEDAVTRVETEMFAVAEAIEGSADLRQSLSDPAIPADRKLAVLNEVFAGHTSELTGSLVRLLVERDMAGSIPQIAQSLAEQGAASRDHALAEVRSAIPLEEETVARLTQELSRITGRTLEVRTVVDPDILGGVVASVGDTVIDGSVLKRLSNLRQTIKT
ncbi:MAG: ATP synthase F1 subunit delta [Acidimicrobiia bacterium]|nr:ATP synthase F1 subunit delta [Acidimicrobiia bacterium]